MPNVIVKGKVVEDFIEEWIRLWRKHKPQEYKTFLALLRDYYEGMYRGDGISKEKLMGYRGLIPTGLYILIENHFPHYLRDRHNRARVEKLICGDFLPRAGKSFTYIDRRPSNAETPTDTD